jgi:acyl-CoA thioesterase
MIRLAAMTRSVANGGVGDLSADTAVEGVDGRYRAHLSRDWEIWGPNGGYIAAIALRAAGAATALPRPATFAGHFLSIAEFDVVDLEVTPLRTAKRAESLRVSMTQQGRPIFEAFVWVVGEVGGLEHDAAEMPAVPQPAQLKPIEALAEPEDLRDRHRFWRNFDVHPIDWVPWRRRPRGAPHWREWLRFRPPPPASDPFVVAAGALLLIDTMGWPAACQPHLGQSDVIAPSLDVYAQFHHLEPQGDWRLVDAAAPVAAHGLIGCQARIWSEAGQLLATGGSQLLCRPAPASVDR